jgi:murein DD-endopeptidase MepM/ murein hydrolase activator NlpD
MPDRREFLQLAAVAVKGKQGKPQPRQQQQKQPALPVQWAPRPLFNGAPVLFRSTSLSGAATWLSRKIEFRPADAEGTLFTALAGVDLSTKPGRYPLVIGDVTIPVLVQNRLYPVSRISVDSRFIEPPKELEKRIDEERELKKRVFAGSPKERLWRGHFAAPSGTRQTSPFGARRTYNGKTRSIHQGLDFAAATGTEIRAANIGIVRIARPMYFEGGLVVIDHGESIFTLYMHLSEFLVKEGQNIGKGEPIAKSGATGRVTGPHLHFSVLWQGAYLEPATLLRL